ncbi:hypothetical protein TVAG_173300 [Trichomonas vaginalis G3]|uniref:F5/8 type C domain-containing protein n=1 Tax=Trichomonas vaginalis (strain ATCC PRA-98 / G3) TaxID=412133 RepID=A2DF80_TRIV3|nr:hypothetical protein TVAGG3_0374160 [Trichomonas vaginalis G3]EAY21072.1 hypothetical protein TVAG_173300 [Trichomonas vaginalis G3]KAI5532818.1 hypothetical protein TVAGG3_0374160 [Trichomonas vaginalis G3]|eukprot:XP_001582058.1 hypothetical protein [Trichomonas vaginalis G3]
MFILLAISITESNAIFKRVHSQNKIVISASGSSKQYINGSIQLTKPEYAIDPIDKSYDWCSNCGRSSTDFPWIIFSLEKAKIKLEKYYLRAGCCYDGCCCEDLSYCVRCCLYSWALQISNDNKTWKDVHKVDKDESMEYCAEKTYQLSETYTAKYFSIIQTEACPGEPPCLCLNKVEFFGDIIADDGIGEIDDFVSYHDDDDDVSIIGHISKNGNTRMQ